jgi:transcriptional antiterminator RfaH
MKLWYLVFTKPREEERAKRNLECRGLSVYYPRIEVQKIKSSRKASVIEPLFPRYLFVNVDNCTNGFAAIRSTGGVSSIIRFNGQLAQVPNSLINSLRKREKDSCAIFSYPQVGDKVRIHSGAFKGTEAIVHEERCEKRVLLLMNIMSRKTPLIAQYSDLSVCI